MDVLVMINGLFLRVKVSNQSRSVQFAHVPDHGASVTVKTGGFLLIKLVVQHKVGLFRVQPALVGVLRAFVAISGQKLRSILVGHINDGKGILVVVEADFMSLVLCIRTTVDDTFGIMGVAISSIATSELRVVGCGDVNHVQTSGACLGADCIQKSSRFVYHNVVRRAEFSVHDCGVESQTQIHMSFRSDIAREVLLGTVLLGRIGKLMQVKNLHPMTCCFGTNVSISLVHFHVSPT
mmetsp:Transcript_61330/g.132915  ORF Transcript_61330/g.132915 Transcript_61330/m.132915 type:complete len:237 (-) Transcript_61330:459-1169(-)